MSHLILIFAVSANAYGLHSVAVLHRVAQIVVTEQARNIFRNKCLDCHGGLNGPDPRHMFGNNGFPKIGRENVVRSTINAANHVRIHMPPNGSEQLTSEEKAILEAWARQSPSGNVPASLDQAIARGMFRRENLVAPAALAAQLNGPPASWPRVWNIGPMENIRGAVNIGDLNYKEGGDKLDIAEAALPSKNVPIIIYCGCCVLEECPNVLRALSVLHARGYTRIKVLNLPNGMSDWNGPMAP